MTDITAKEVKEIAERVTSIEKGFIRLEVVLERIAVDLEKTANIDLEPRLIKVETKMEEVDRRMNGEDTRTIKMEEKIDANGYRLAMILGGVTVLANAINFFLN